MDAVILKGIEDNYSGDFLTKFVGKVLQAELASGCSGET